MIQYPKHSTQKTYFIESDDNNMVVNINTQKAGQITITRTTPRSRKTEDWPKIIIFWNIFQDKKQGHSSKVLNY